MASEGDSACVPESEEQPMITNPVPIKVASRAVVVLGNFRVSILVSMVWWARPFTAQLREAALYDIAAIHGRSIVISKLTS
jgi:hypothetical protein